MEPTTISDPVPLPTPDASLSGVCLGIGAWNYPIQIAAWKAAPALAAGNSLIFKPSELTPATAVELGAIFTEAGLPDGVFNVVHGDVRVGAPLVSHPGIHKVSLTGSVQTGQKVMAGAAATLKALTMELGGKSPLVIFDDAHLENAITAAMLGNFYTQGRDLHECNAGLCSPLNSGCISRATHRENRKAECR